MVAAACAGARLQAQLLRFAKDGKGNPVATDVAAHHRPGGRARAQTHSPRQAKPPVRTGTGEALLLDGHDAALVRASIVDADGRVMHMATNNITFTVLSGPGRVQGATLPSISPHPPARTHAHPHARPHARTRPRLIDG